ncbi:PAS domain S-box-containing protein [Thermanaeromonas toyohensis ToBE]|uniref:PAS domain S-box-containing protein n=1 Tax=Thermanaeromonas toyohensis ToBE TaxID=698762 RepID=A0A1W1VXK0_9FIRM|nr:sigma 54-interacting transcriptional regulator [Thermanaeromonas toyohensis]SMB98058.1 PAS domain S-box-containing protein [Thermanaeromonas toyohensis ToBE]
MPSLDNLVTYILTLLNHGLIWVNKSGIITEFNPQALVILGVPGQDVRGRKLTEVFPASRLSEVLTTRQPLVGTKVQGIKGAIRVSYFPLPEGEGNTVIVLEQWDTGHDLAEIYEALLAELPLGLAVVDKEGKLVFINKYCASLVGWREESAVGLPVAQVLPFSRLFEVVTTGRSYLNPEVQFKGQRLCLAEIPLKNKSGEILGGISRVLPQEAILQDNFKDFYHQFKIMENRLLLYKDELEFLQENLSPWVAIQGISPQIKELKKLAARVAQGEANVLLLGESGTGKDLFARAIHQASRRRKEPFIKINCAAIPENLLEAELFGYEEGAFTGAARGGKPGKFELADGGTVFLDEIGDLPLSMQPKLLRVLQERSFERIGGRKTLNVDVRIIAATNKDLVSLVKEGKFRLDLYYRLAVITLHIPPLRERPMDIEPICRSLIQKFNIKYMLEVQGLSPKVKELFEEYSWPGNVRELENVLEYAFNFLDPEDKLILPEHLPPTFPQSISSGGFELKKAVALAEQEAIKKALLAAKGNKQEAARLLGIHPSGLYQKLKKYNLNEG